MGCKGCPESPARCVECAAILAPVDRRFGVCRRCRAFLLFQGPSLAIMEEDPDERPYIWDLEE